MGFRLEVGPDLFFEGRAFNVWSVSADEGFWERNDLAIVINRKKNMDSL